MRVQRAGSVPTKGRPAHPATAVFMALALLAAGLVPLVGGAAPVGAATVRPITFPVHPDDVAKVYWSDTYGAPRGGGRSHIGVDIMGPKMTRLVAAADGRVSWLRHDTVRGNNLNITDDDGWTYYYIHINNDTPGTDDGANDWEFAFAEGVAPGARVRAGQVVAYLGDSGNAEETAPHLHFEISDPSGTPINPTPSVDAAFAALSSPSVSADALGPYGTLSSLSTDVYRTLLGRAPTAAETTSLAAALNSGGLSRALEPFVSPSSTASGIDRLYVAYFLRPPDFDGYRYWIDVRGAGTGVAAVADYFAESEEFRLRYGHLPFGEFLDQLYVDVLNRTPDEAGKAYWLDLLDRGIITKGSIVVQFTEGQELINRTAHRSEIVALSALFDKQRPSDTEIAQWVADRQTLSLSAAIEAWFLP